MRNNKYILNNINEFFLLKYIQLLEKKYLYSDPWNNIDIHNIDICDHKIIDGYGSEQNWKIFQGSAKDFKNYEHIEKLWSNQCCNVKIFNNFIPRWNFVCKWGQHNYIHSYNFIFDYQSLIKVDSQCLYIYFASN